MQEQDLVRLTITAASNAGGTRADALQSIVRIAAKLYADEMHEMGNNRDWTADAIGISARGACYTLPGDTD